MQDTNTPRATDEDLAFSFPRLNRHLRHYTLEEIEQFGILLDVLMLEGFSHPRLAEFMAAWGYAENEAKRRWPASGLR